MVSNRFILIVAGALIAIGLLYEFSIHEAGDEGDMTIARVDQSRVKLDGTLGSASLRQLRGYLAANPQVQTLELGRMSGTIDVDATLDMARWVRRQQLDTALTAQSWIASGAVDLFVSGVDRSMTCGALVGVHAWAYTRGVDGTDIENPNDYRHRAQISFLNDMGLDGDSFYWFKMRAAPPEDMHYMSVDEINRFRLTSEPLNCGAGTSA